MLTRMTKDEIYYGSLRNAPKIEEVPNFIKDNQQIIYRKVARRFILYDQDCMLDDEIMEFMSTDLCIKNEFLYMERAVCDNMCCILNSLLLEELEKELVVAYFMYKYFILYE